MGISVQHPYIYVIACIHIYMYCFIKFFFFFFTLMHVVSELTIEWQENKECALSESVRGVRTDMIILFSHSAYLPKRNIFLSQHCLLGPGVVMQFHGPWFKKSNVGRGVQFFCWWTSCPGIWHHLSHMCQIGVIITYSWFLF